MVQRNVVTIGEHGVNPTTHCFISGAPLGNAPTNYSLGANHYVSCNHNHSLGVQELEKLREQYGPIGMVTFAEEQIEDIADDN